MKNAPNFICVNGNTIAYHRSGQGDPLLLVHGITTYSFIWQGLMPDLSRCFDVIAVDLLGCGLSDKPEGADYSIKAQATLLSSLLEQLGIEKVHLVTHDIGGGVGQILAVTRPELLRSLTLINSIGYDFWPVQPIITLRIPIIRQFAMAALDFGLFAIIVRSAIYHKELATKELINGLWLPLQEREGRYGFLRLAKSLDNQQLLDIVPALRNLRLPTLIIRGDADPFLGAKISEQLHADIQGAELFRVATASHYLQIDEPALLVEKIVTFCTGVDNA